MLLDNKVAVIYGAAGAVGSSSARAFAREGAIVHLAGRTQSSLDALAEEIRLSGGKAESSVVNALDADSIESHLAEVVRISGRIDISYNLIPTEDVQGISLVDMALPDFLAPIEIAMKTQFLTTIAAGRYMARQGAGVLLALTANAARRPGPQAGGFGVSCAAIEALFRQLAIELGPSGVRAVVLRSPGSPDTPGVREVMSTVATNEGIPLEELIERWAGGFALRKYPYLADVADAAALAASDHARTITGAILNVTCGELLD